MAEMKKAAETLKSKAEDIGTATKEHGAAAATEARSAVSDLAQSARTRVEEEASTVQTSIADGIDAVAGRVSEAAGKMAPDAPHTRSAEAVAGRLEGAAQAVRDTDLQILPERLSAFARRNPAAFLGGAAILGIAVGRFLKAQSPTPEVASLSDLRADDARRGAMSK